MTLRPREEIRALLEGVDLPALIEQDQPIERDGSRWQTVCPFHDDHSPSLKIFADGGWKCFGCGAYGDAITWRVKKHNETFNQAIEFLGAAPRLAEPRKPSRRKYTIEMPAPRKAPRFSGHHRTLGEPIATWVYRNNVGDTLLIDCRYRFQIKGEWKKSVLTWCWARDDEGTESWTCTRPSDHMPIYGRERLAKAPADSTVVLVEGCKTADAAAKLWPAVVPMTWCGGSKSAGPRHDLSPLHGRTVILLPDYDKVGAAAMSRMVPALRAAGVTEIQVIDLRGLQIPPLEDAPDGEGWDVADPLPAGISAGDLLTRVVTGGNVDSALLEMMRVFPGKLEGKDLDKLNENAGEVSAGDGGAGDDDSGTTIDGEPPPKDDDDIERGDIANASRFVRQHRARARYCATYERWHLWNGRVWEPDETGEVMILAEETAREAAREFIEQSRAAFTEAKELQGKALSAEDTAADELRYKAKTLNMRGARLAAKAEQAQSRKKMIDMVELAKSRREIVVRAEQLDSHEHLFACANGVIDLRTGRKLAHNPDWLMTQCSAVEYHADATDPALDRVLASMLEGDAERITYAQLTLGASLFGNNRLEEFYLWHGHGGSGKGTLFEGAKSAIGRACMTAEFKTFVRVQGHRVRDDLARLGEARVVLASEVEKGEALDHGVLKSITGNDTVTSRHLYGSYFEYRPRLTLHLQCNELPRVDDQDSGMWRRMVIIPCGPQVPDDQRDPALKQALLDPKRGGRAILAWLVKGAVASSKLKRLPRPPAVLAAIARFRGSSNPIAAFIEEALRLPLPDHRERTWCTRDDLIGAYHTHCQGLQLDRRFRLGDRSLIDRLEALGCSRVKKRVVKHEKAESTPVWCVYGITIAGHEHDAMRQVTTPCTFMPAVEEHEAALLAVPQFHSSTGVEKSPLHDHARARTSSTILPISKEQWNSGTAPSETTQGPVDLGDLPPAPQGGA